MAKSASKSSEVIQKDWKFYLGMVFLCLSFILPLLGLLVPIFDLPIAIQLF